MRRAVSPPGMALSVRTQAARARAKTPRRDRATTLSLPASKPTEGRMDIWDYDRKTGVLLGLSAADPNPEDPGAWLIPAFSTTVRPPLVPEGCVAIFNGGLSAVGEWRIEMLDFTGVGVKE